MRFNKFKKFIKIFIKKLAFIKSVCIFVSQYNETELLKTSKIKIMYTYKNIKTNETKEVISTLSFVLADEYFCCKYYYLNNDWVTIQIK